MKKKKMEKKKKKTGLGARKFIPIIIITCILSIFYATSYQLKAYSHTSYRGHSSNFKIWILCIYL